MITAINAIIDWLGQVWNKIWSFGSWLLDGAIEVLKAVPYMIMDGILTCIEGIFNTFDFSTTIASAAGEWAHLPTQMIYIINAIGIPQGITMLVAAIGLRMLINLIPAEFTRV